MEIIIKYWKVFFLETSKAGQRLGAREIRRNLQHQRVRRWLPNSVLLLEVPLLLPQPRRLVLCEVVEPDRILLNSDEDGAKAGITTENVKPFLQERTMQVRKEGKGL